MKIMQTYTALFFGVIMVSSLVQWSSALGNEKVTQDVSVKHIEKDSSAVSAKSLDTRDQIVSKKTDIKKEKIKATTGHKAATQKVSTVEKKNTQHNESLPAKKLPKGDLVDAIVVVIYGDEGVQIITKSDLARLSIDGQERTKDEIILERLMFLDAQKMHMVQGDDAVDAYLNTIQSEHNMSREQLEYLFANSGYSYEEAREQLRILYAVNSIIDFKIRSRLIVPEQDVVAYHKSHPVMLQPTYQVQMALVAYPDGVDKERFAKEVASWCTSNTGSIKPIFEDPFWIEQHDIAENKKFITTMNKGACVVSDKTPEGIEILQLVDKKDEREQSLEERYREIVDILRRPKYEEMLADYKKQLFESASIVYL